MPDDTNNETETTKEELMDLLAHSEKRIKLLTQANADLQLQLSAALAVNHTPLLRFGEGTSVCVVNARSIEALYLQQGVTLSSPPMPSGKWRVMLDQREVTKDLEPEVALAKLRLVEKAWIEALEPPE